MLPHVRKNTSEEHMKMMRGKPESFWQNESEHRLRLFQEAAKRIPAYSAFLKKHRISPASIENTTDLSKVPAINKKDYLKAYPLAKLCWDGNLKKPLVFTSTSGSTGEPFYFPREEQIDWQSSIIHELFFLNNKKSLKEPTLILVCFGMGVWIGGLITYQAFEMTREKGYPISLLTPGINKAEIFKALRQIAPQFKQIIMVGYAPFIKDVIDEAPEHGIDIKKLNPRLIFAAEAFTEKFRDHLVKKAGIKNPLVDTMNIYGSADIGTMAFETPISILIRRIATAKPELFRALFGDIKRTPTLAQYNPLFTSFEAIDGELYITGDSAIPLIKYRIGDHGGVFSFSDVKKICKEHGVNIEAEARKAGIGSLVYQMPFVYVYERIDLSTTLYGLQIYPETIREVLLEQPFHEYLTGKMTLVTKFNRGQDQYLEINLEVKKKKKLSKALITKLTKTVVANLRLKNSEFRELSNFLGKRSDPKIVTWPAEHALHFKPGIKQAWVKK